MKAKIWLLSLFAFFSSVSVVQASTQDGRMVLTKNEILYIGNDGYLYSNTGSTGKYLGFSGVISSPVEFASDHYCIVDSNGSGSCTSSFGFSSVPTSGVTNLHSWDLGEYGYYVRTYVNGGNMSCDSNVGSIYPCSPTYKNNSLSNYGNGCAIDANDDLYCKGWPYGNTPYSVTGNFSKVSAVADKDGNGNVYYAAISQDGILYENIPWFDFSSGTYSEVVSVSDNAGGYNYSNAFCAVKTDGSIECHEQYGSALQVGIPTFPVYGVKLSQNYVCAFKVSDNSLYCWGSTLPPGYPNYNIYNPTPAPEVPTFYVDGMECETVGIPDVSNAEFNDFWGASITSPAYIVTQTFENGCVSKTTYGTGANGAEDAFAWQCYGSGTDIPQGAVTFPGTENAKFLFNYNIDTDTQFFEISSNRNFGPYPANVYIFSGATNAPNSAWGRFNIFTTNNNRYGGVVYASGGVATLLLADGEYSMNLRISTAQSFKGFLMGKAPIVNKVQCSVPEKNNFCNWDIQGLDFGCYPRISGGFENGICAVDDKGRCSPKVSTGGTVEVGPPLPGQIEVFDGSGNVSYTYDAGGKIKGSRLQADSIFDCSEYPDGFTGWLPCARKVARNIVSLISDSVNSVNGKSESGISKPLTEVGGYTGSISFSGVNPNGYNGIDTIVRKSWNEAYGEGSGTNLMRFAKIVSVGAFFLLFIFITILMANANRGGKSGGNT